MTHRGVLKLRLGVTVGYNWGYPRRNLDVSPCFQLVGFLGVDKWNQISKNVVIIVIIL